MQAVPNVTVLVKDTTWTQKIRYCFSINNTDFSVEAKMDLVGNHKRLNGKDAPFLQHILSNLYIFNYFGQIWIIKYSKCHLQSSFYWNLPNELIRTSVMLSARKPSNGVNVRNGMSKAVKFTPRCYRGGEYNINSTSVKRVSNSQFVKIYCPIIWQRRDYAVLTLLSDKPPIWGPDEEWPFYLILVETSSLFIFRLKTADKTKSYILSKIMLEPT